MKLPILILDTLFGANAYADQKYNSYTGKWETVKPHSTLQYNSVENERDYVDPDETIEYNAHEDAWQFPQD